MDKTKYSEAWAEIGQSVIDEFAKDKFKSIVDLGISIGYVLSEKSKGTKDNKVLAECIPVRQDHTKQFNPHHYLIKIYEPNVKYMNDKQKRILMEHELMHIKARLNDDDEIEAGTIAHDVQDFKDIIDKYGIDWAEDMSQQITWDDYESNEEEGE